MDRELYGTFRTAANSISALYTSSLSLQKRAFNGGARHATERLLTWALAHGEGTLSASDLAAALQAELVVLEGEDAGMRAAAEGGHGGSHGATPARGLASPRSSPQSRSQRTREERPRRPPRATRDDRLQRHHARRRRSNGLGTETRSGVLHRGRSGENQIWTQRRRRFSSLAPHPRAQPRALHGRRRVRVRVRVDGTEVDWH